MKLGKVFVLEGSFCRDSSIRGALIWSGHRVEFLGILGFVSLKSFGWYHLLGSPARRF